MANSLSVQLDAPQLSRDDLSFCATHRAELGLWVEALPLVNTQESATQLEQAMVEIAMLRAPAPTRLEFLEVLRPIVHYICTRLDRQSLKRPSNHANAVSTAQRLFEKLSVGYKSVVIAILDEVQESDDADKANDILGLALHRLISDMSRTLLRALQHYIAVPKHFWRELNQLYRLSEQRDMAELRYRDEENHTVLEMSILETYLRALLLASCKPNQLKQQQLTLVFNAIESWTRQVALVPSVDEALICVDLAGDEGPKFVRLSKALSEPRALRTEVLAYEIEAYLKEIESSIEIPATLPNSLLHHLVDAWSVMQARAFRRLPAAGPIRVCIGLRACHYFLSGGVEFANQLSGTEELLRREVNPFLDVQYEKQDEPHSDDPWSQAHDLKVAIPHNPNIDDPDKILLAGREQTPEPQSETPAYTHYETEAVDTSPGGYCIRWLDGVPAKSQVGELIALREERDSRWCVATIRWIRQEGGHATMGIELLSPKAIPVAIRVIQKRGGPTDFTRALLLPQIDAIGQSATLITPRVPFAPGQKLHIQRQGIQTTGQLTKIELNTESFNQFTFRMLDGYLENARTGSKMGDLSEMTREDTT
jgi:hypothetical protein